MNTPPDQPSPGNALSDLETRLSELVLSDPGDDLCARLEAELAAAYTRRRRFQSRITRLTWAACLTLFAGSLALLAFDEHSPGTRELDTDHRLVSARYTGRSGEGASYEATFERRVFLPVTQRCRIVVSVPEQRTVLIPDEPF